MSLENLARIGKLKQHSATSEDAAKLLAAARRNLAETRIKGLSPETRFDLAYKAIMQCGLLAIMGNGYRPSTNEPGHHATVIQTLPVTIGLQNDRMIILDKFRRTRNLNDYSGDVVSEEEAAACIRAAEALLRTLITGSSKTERIGHNKVVRGHLTSLKKEKSRERVGIAHVAAS